VSWWFCYVSLVVTHGFMGMNSPRIELGDDGYRWGGLTMVCEFCLHFLFVQDFWLWTCGV
jgi:hypothetical protein